MKRFWGMAGIESTTMFNFNDIMADQIKGSANLSDAAKKIVLDWLSSTTSMVDSDALDRQVRVAVWKTGPYANLDQATAELYTAQAAAAAGRAKASNAGSAAASAVGQAQEQAQAVAQQSVSNYDSAYTAGRMDALQTASAAAPSSEMTKILLWGGGAFAAFWLAKKIL